MRRGSHTSESLSGAVDRMKIVGPAYYSERTSLDDYEDIGHLDDE